MTKSDARIVTASADVAAIVDRGFEVDTELKNLGFEDKGLKTKIVEAAVEVLEDGEASVRLEGSSARVLVSSTEKLDIKASAERYAEVRTAVKGGLLDGVVDRKLVLTVPQGDMERAAEILKEAGVTATVSESLSVKVADWRRAAKSEAASTEHGTAQAALGACLESTVSHRVKYEKR